jgi:hypothetical protein
MRDAEIKMQHRGKHAQKHAKALDRPLDAGLYMPVVTGEGVSKLISPSIEMSIFEHSSSPQGGHFEQS